MTAVRMTQRLMAQHSIFAMQTNLNRLSASQDRLSTGKAINRPSDNPTGTNDAMRLRAAIATNDQHTTNAQDGLSWLTDSDSTLTSMLDSVRTARDLIVRGSSTGSNGPDARAVLATQLTAIRSSLIDEANTQHLGRPLFGGTTAGTAAYDASGTYLGDGNTVSRTVGDGISVPVNTTGPAAFSAGGTDLFSVISTAIDQLTNDPDSLSGSLTTLDTVSKQMTSALTDVGARYNRLDAATTALANQSLNNKTSLSNVEDVDPAQAIMDVQIQTTAYQAALGATAKVIQPSLLDFLR